MDIQRKVLTTAALASVLCGGHQLCAAAKGVQKDPNIIYILADDMGYGDVSCLNPDGKIPTPNIDRLAANGIRFTDAHSSSAVCTPSRYSILTGRYSWRSYLKENVAWEHHRHIVETGRMTVASLLKQRGYHTASIGKWHLAWDWAFKPGRNKKIDFTKPITNGPRSCGFDYSFMMLASLDIPPYVYVENERITGVPDRFIRGRRGKIFQKDGPMGCDFKSEEAFDKFAEHALAYMDERMKAKEKFFLYFPLTAPHVPLLPTEKYQGMTHTNEYGDYCAMIDDVVGKIVQKVKDYDMLENTIIVFTADNGAAPSANFSELRRFGHHPNYIYRGIKTDLYEGGHRIPMIIQYPALIKKGMVSHQLVVQNDFFATVADLLKISYPDNAGEDSVSNLPLWTGTQDPNKPLRDYVIHHSLHGKFAIRHGKWKLLLAKDSAGWGGTKKDVTDISQMQLFDLSQDPRERHNLIADHLDMARELIAVLKKQVEDGRSTPGARQKNTAPEYWDQLKVLKLID